MSYSTEFQFENDLHLYRANAVRITGEWEFSETRSRCFLQKETCYKDL